LNAYNESYQIGLKDYSVEMVHIRERIDTLQEKIRLSVNQLNEIRNKKRKQLMKIYETDSVPDDDVERAIRNEKNRINTENVEYKNEIKHLQERVNMSSFLQKRVAAFYPLVIVKDNIVNMNEIKQLNDKQRYDLVHQYIKHITITNIDTLSKKIVITAYSGNTYSYLYYYRKKEDMKKLHQTIIIDGRKTEGFISYKKNIIISKYQNI
jgi:hypothetical protein